MSGTTATNCPHHERVAADVARHQEWIGDVQTELRDHCRNGGTGHVSRGEFDRLAADVAGIKSMLIKAGLAIALLAGGSSALGPTIAKLLTGG